MFSILLPVDAYADGAHDSGLETSYSPTNTASAAWVPWPTVYSRL
jgi:hypothetical protein